MANQYVCLKCECGEEVILAKRMASGFYLPYRKKQFFEIISKFFSEHEFCIDNRLDTFDISYEYERE